MSVTTHADDKPQALEPYPMTRTRRRQIDEVMIDTEEKSFRTINSSLGWHGFTVPPLCSFYSSYSQQKISDRRIPALQSQFSGLRVVKKHGTQLAYLITHRRKEMNLVFFADVSRTKESSQLCYIIGLAVGPV